MKILVLGATGTFGSRLCDRLLVHTNADLIVASRSIVRAEALASVLKSRATPLAVTLPEGIGLALEATEPDLVIDASGPFQGNAYTVPAAVVARGVHYLDLADARDYVTGINDLEDLAKANNAVILSGASSVPALSVAVVDHLANGLACVEEVDMGISTAGGFALGEAVIRANMACAGQPIPVLQGGKKDEITGWLKQKRRTLRVAGMPVLRRRLFAPTDVPDLDLQPARYPALRTVRFYGGSELRVLQYGLALLSQLRKLGMLPKLGWLAPILTMLCRLLTPFGSGRSGMFVEVTGESKAGVVVRRTWTIIAEDGDGLYVPTLAAVALARRMADDDMPAPGARTAAGELTLEDFDPLIAELNMATEVKTETLPIPVFELGLGEEEFAALPGAVRNLHRIYGTCSFSGRGTVERGTSFLSRLAGRSLRLPPAMVDSPLAVTIERRGGMEYWLRDFAGHHFSSELSVRPPHRAGLFYERFGLVTGMLCLRRSGDRLMYECTGFRALGVLLPRGFGPRVIAYEEEDKSGHFRFFVEIRLPRWMMGGALIVRYSGWLTADWGQ